MIPDKIFLGVGPLSVDEPNKKYLYAEWYEEQKPLVQNIAYIRKDALLEWLEKRLHEVGLAGTIHIIDVIDKLNSM